MYLWNDFGLVAHFLRWKRQRRLIRGWEERRRRGCSKERMERVKARECSNTHQGKEDSVIRNSNILVLSETWLGNESDISIPNFNSIVKNKRPNTSAGGVAIYQNSSDAVNIITPSMECSVSQSDIYGSIQSSVGDLCLIECVIDNGQKIITVAVYITPYKKLDDIIEFLHRSLLPYTSRGSALLNKNYNKIPMILMSILL
ncbi:SWIM-type domain-containing protein [Trichonephila clavipes]|nr:SWIM-type domain-containing protein [Trichonephila clavipes]